MKPINVKNIILCADDYGLNASISQGIIDLLQRQRLSAVSCLSSAPLWPQAAVLLKPFHDLVDLGLHFNLTEGKPVSDLYIQKYGENFFSLEQLILRAFLGRLDVTILEQECEAQLQRFVSELGFLPDFIDGHQHIQQLPLVRTALMRVYEKHLRGKNAYLRSVLNKPRALGLANKIKQFIIYLCGSPRFQHLLIQGEIPHNTSFAGIYSFSQAAQYAQILPYFLETAQDQGLIMCHPGLKNEAAQGDPIADARFFEYSYLSSQQFSADCEVRGIKLGRLSDFSVITQ